MIMTMIWAMASMSEADLFLGHNNRVAPVETQATAMARGARCSPLQEAQHALEQVWQE